MDLAFSEIEKNGSYFIVAGRKINDQFVDSSSFDSPSKWDHIFKKIKFRLDISSTDIRLKLKK